MDAISSRRAAEIVVRQAVTEDDVAAVVALQRAVWGTASPVVPGPHVIAVAHAGGTVLVARDPAENDQAVGFCYGFVGLDTPAEPDDGEASADEPILWSHMLGVLPAWRGRGLGRRLKLAQAELARRRGLTRILWTFDPLEAANAHLNLSRLGAIAARYHVNRYGVMDDALNVGLESDRLVADWWVGDQAAPVRPAPSGQLAVVLNPDPPTGPVVEPGRVAGHPGGVRIAVPAGDWRKDLALARAWRRNVRAAFLTAFGAGYVATDIDIRQAHAFYRLERDD